MLEILCIIIPFLHQMCECCLALFGRKWFSANFKGTTTPIQVLYKNATLDFDAIGMGYNKNYIGANKHVQLTQCPTRRYWKWSTGCCQSLYQLFLIFYVAELSRKVHSFQSLSQSYTWFRKSMSTLQLWTVSHLSGNTVVCWQKLISLIL